jgi:hypothetical protein
MERLRSVLDELAQPLGAVDRCGPRPPDVLEVQRELRDEGSREARGEILRSLLGLILEGAATTQHAAQLIQRLPSALRQIFERALDLAPLSIAVGAAYLQGGMAAAESTLFTELASLWGRSVAGAGRMTSEAIPIALELASLSRESAQIVARTVSFSALLGAGIAAGTAQLILGALHSLERGDRLRAAVELEGAWRQCTLDEAARREVGAREGRIDGYNADWSVTGDLSMPGGVDFDRLCLDQGYRDGVRRGITLRFSEMLSTPAPAAPSAPTAPTTPTAPTAPTAPSATEPRTPPASVRRP